MIAGEQADKRRDFFKLLKPEHRWTWMLLFAVVLTVLFFRQPGALRHPDFYAEDGAIFFKQQYEEGLIHVLFAKYAGYLHLAPRLIAALTSFFPLEHVPRIYAAICLVLAAGSLVFFYSAKFRSVISSDAARVAVILLATLMPNSDPLMRLNSISFYGLLFIVLTTLMELPASLWRRIGLFALLTVAIWSTPMAILCLPVILLRLWQSELRKDRIWWVALAASIVAYACTADVQQTGGILQQANVFQSALHAIGYRVFCFFFLGSTLARPLPTAGWDGVVVLSLLLAGLCVAAAFAIAKQRLRNSERQWWTSFALLYFVLALPTLFVLRVNWIPDFLGPMTMRTWLWHQRYFFCSTLLLCVLAGMAYDTILRNWLRKNIVTLSSAGALLGCWISLHLAGFSLWDWHTEPAWKRVAQQIRAAENRVQNTGQSESIHIRNAERVWEFDLIVKNSRNPQTAAQ